RYLEANAVKSVYFFLAIKRQLDLDSRGIDLYSIRCPICDEAIESEEHQFVECYVAKDTWKGVIDWWQINSITIATVEDVIALVDTAPVRGNLKIFFDLVVQTTLWSLCRFCNDRFLPLGWHLEEIQVTWAHLEKKRTRLRLYTKNHEELFIQSLETAPQP
ncbi:hypothetical protein Tco_0817119, partial [Tanacetum coccineum]